jgi:multiple sugar transport system substrate-binding protein
MDKALDMYAKTATVGPPDELNMDVGGTRGLFTTGRCALSMDWGRHRDADARNVRPGQDRGDDHARLEAGPRSGSGKLVACDANTCPNAVDGVNYAPFASFGGWSGAINAASPKENQDALYDFLSYMSAPAQSGIDVTLGKTGLQPVSHIALLEHQPWLDAGLSQAAAENYLGAIKSSLENTNMVLDMRIPLTKRYQQDVSTPRYRNTSQASSMPPRRSRPSPMVGMRSPTRPGRTPNSPRTSPALASSGSSVPPTLRA